MSAPVIYKNKETGVEHSLPKLTPADIVALGEKVYARARERLLTDLESAGADPDLRMAELKELDRRRGLGSVVVGHGFTVEGAIEIIERSIKISGNGISIDSLELDPSAGMHQLALKLIGVNWDELTSGQDDDDLDSDPTKSSLGTG